jgi:hypothetical protein
MKRISMGDWSVIARYLKKEARAEDEDRFALLVDRCPNLKEELEEMDRVLNVPLPSLEIAHDKLPRLKSLLYDLKRRILSDRLGHFDKILVVLFSADHII